MIVSMLAAMALIAEAQPAADPAQPAPAAPAAKPAKKAKTDGLVCRKEAELGTRFTRKVCVTREQAEERRRLDQETTYRAQQTAPAPSN